MTQSVQIAHVQVRPLNLDRVDIVVASPIHESLVLQSCRLV